MTCSLLISFVFYKVTTFCFDCFFWLHQCLNTTSYVGILLLPCGAPKDRDGGICESPLPYPLDSNSSTRGIRCGGACRLPRACDPFSQLNSGAVARPQFGIWCSCRCSGRYRSRFSRFRLALGRSFFICGGMDCSFLRLRGGFAKIFRRICANRGWVASLAENGMKYQIISNLNRTNALYNMVLPSQFGEMDLHQTKLKQ